MDSFVNDGSINIFELLVKFRRNRTNQTRLPALLDAISSEVFLKFC